MVRKGPSGWAGSMLNSFLGFFPPLWPLSFPGCNSTVWALRPAGTSETCCCMTNAKLLPCGKCPVRGLERGSGLSGGQLRSRVCSLTQCAWHRPTHGIVKRVGVWPHPAPQVQIKQQGMGQGETPPAIGAKKASCVAKISLG